MMEGPPPVPAFEHGSSNGTRPQSRDTRPPSRQSFLASGSKSKALRPTTRGSTTATSPEVISTLISSLSAISSPAEDFYDSLLPDATGKSKDLRNEAISEESGQAEYLSAIEAAGSPIVRTSRPKSFQPSGTPTKTSTPPVAFVSSGSISSIDKGATIGKISIEPRNAPSTSSVHTYTQSRSNSIRSSGFRESKDRVRDLERKSKGKFRDNGRQSPAMGMRQTTDTRGEPIAIPPRSSKRAKSESPAPSLPPFEFPKTVVGHGLSVPSRESSKRHSFQGHRNRRSANTSIAEEPAIEAAAEEQRPAKTSPSQTQDSETATKDAEDRIRRLKEQKEARARAEIEEKLLAIERRVPITTPTVTSLPPSHLTVKGLGLDFDKENHDPAGTPRKSGQGFQRSVTDPLSAPSSKRPGRPPPSIADSIDDAIDDYLDHPRLTQRIKDPISGRVIAFSEVGDPEGSVVFCCVGMGTTRYLTAFYDELATTLRLRLITPDRPGIGESEPYPDASGTPLGWPDDIRTICIQLGIQRFSVLAHSAGAVYALATALRMPQHIRCRIHLLAPWIPPSQMVAIGIRKDESPITTLPYSQRILRSLPSSFFRIANSSLFIMTSSSIASARPEKQKRRRRRSANEMEELRDKNIFKSRRNSLQVTPGYSDGLAQDAMPAMPDIMDAGNSPVRSGSIMSKSRERESEYEMRLVHAIWAAAIAYANPSVDLLVCLERRQQIGFRYADINKEVIIHHGSKDTRVPVENIVWLGGRMRRCEVRVLEGEGHGLMASAKVMSDVLTEIAQEWDDWNAIIKSGKK